MATKKFIQLGERKNGRITKNEQYTIEELRNLFLSMVVTHEKPNWFHCKFRTRTYIDWIEADAYEAGFGDAFNEVFDTFETLIENDKAGKSTRKKK